MQWGEPPQPHALLLVYCMLMAVAAPKGPPETVQVDTDSFLAGFNGPFPTVNGYAGTEISSTVSMLYQTDWDVNYVGRAADGWNSKIIDMLYRANESKAKVVNFMVTHYWVDDNFDGTVGKKGSAASVLRCVLGCVLAPRAVLQLCWTTPVTATAARISTGASRCSCMGMAGQQLGPAWACQHMHAMQQRSHCLCILDTSCS